MRQFSDKLLTMPKILAIVFCIGCVSCHDTYEWSSFEPFEFETEGILLDSHSNGNHYTVIPWTGAKFTIKSAGKHLEHDWMEFISVDNSSRHEHERPDNMDSEIESKWSGEWGTATHFRAGPPYVSEYVINPNETGENREIKISINGAYISADIYITQPPKPQ